MNDSLLDELERAEEEQVSHYEPLLGPKATLKTVLERNSSGETDVWSELHEESTSISNTDKFFTNIYNFYYHKGLTSIIVSGLVDVVNLFFTISLSTFLLGCVNWGFMSECRGSSCKFSNYVSCRADWGMYKVMIFFYCTLFMSYWVWVVANYIENIKSAREAHIFFRDRLNISDRELQIMDWNSIISRVLKLSFSNMKLSAHEVAARIMRKENYLVAFFNKKILGLEADLPDFFFCSRIGLSNMHRNFFTKGMEWNIHFCILDHMFTEQFAIRRRFLVDAEGLRKRFIIAGVANFFMIPFVLLFMIIHFFLKHTQEWHTQRNYLGPRQWSSYAIWQFREFNELQHVFDNRISKSFQPAQQYISLFPNRVLSVVARGFSFLSGSLLAVLFLISLYDENLLLHIHIYSRHLLWYFTILAVVFAVSRSFLSSEEDNNADAEETMLLLASHTHYMPSHWKGNCHSFDVRDEFFSLFQYKAKLFLLECFSVILTPYILCFCLPKRAEQILEFIKKYSVQVPGLGSVCQYSLFDFEKLGNMQYGCPKANSTNVGDTSNDGKMEKSFLNFKENHPDWKSNLEGEKLFNRIESYKGEQEAVALEKSLASLNTMSHMGSLGFFSKENIGERKEENLGQGSYMLGGSISQQLFQSQALQSVLGSTNHENHFYWLEKYYQAQMQDS